jgi:hypothetical protein
MDVESLVDGNAQETTVAHQIFRVALDERRWTAIARLGLGVLFVGTGEHYPRETH